MQMQRFVLSCLAAIAVADGTGDLDFASIGRFDIKEAGYTHVTKFKDSDDFLLVSSMSALPFVDGFVSVVPGIKAAVEAGDVSSLNPVKLNTGSTHFTATNDAKVVPHDVFGQRAIVVPDGFLIPYKKHGGIYVIQMDESDVTVTKDTVKISPEKDGYYYFGGHWVDMNGDGRKDFLTARSNAEKGGGELVWFEHPEGGLNTAPWQEHVVTKGPEMMFEATVLPELENEIVLFSAEYYNQKLAFYRVSTVDGTLVDSQTIDSTTIGGAYSAKLVDLNGDGKRQLLVNNFEKDAETNGVFAYTVPDDLSVTGELEFEKFTIASHFKPAFSIFNMNRAPSFPYAIYPNGQKQGERAHILVAGSGDHMAHVLTPTGDASKFEYEKHMIVETGGIVPGLDTADLDGDGWLEMYMAQFDDGYVEVFKLSGVTEEPESFLQ